MENTGVNKEKQQEIREKLEYQRAVYRFHDCDDPALKEHFGSIIKAYEKKHNIGQKKEDPRQQLLPGFVKEFNVHGLA